MTTRDRLQDTAYVLIIVAVGLLLLYFARNFLIPLVLAIMTWGLLNALANQIGRIRLGSLSLPRWLALLLAVTSLLAFFLLVYQILASQSEALSRAAPVYQENLNALFNRLVTRFGIEELPASDMFLERVNIGTLLGWLGGSVGNLLSALILVSIYTGFLFAEQGVMRQKLDAMTGSAGESSRLYSVIDQIAVQVQNYIGMKTLVSMATGLLSYGVLKWVGVDFAAVWALLIFLLNYIPNIGSIVGVILPALLTLVQFDNLTPFLIITLGLGAVQFLIGNLVEPALMGKSLNLSSFMIILSLTFWGMLWGIAGMFLSVPIMVMIAIVCANIDGLRGIAVVLSADGKIPE
ncbi:MAG: AI-2E family transporter [Xanthomonadales bacterium]|jgi:predicted PurR-regulated permease PerM|nr:AI-2E family transporter [Xanthomonadales bacterium]